MMSRIRYILDKAAIKGECKKLGPIWKGQGVVANKVSAYLYNALMVLNHMIKLCRDRTLPLWFRHCRENPQIEDPANASNEKIY